ncbi:hypothetical protein MBEHAL_1868 [Halarchaeum acidiphilum MH1-52-1]|uniref:DUF5305 domain-containing protein n=1 Tax=Halarchaeum acidiphilum MH1-52-1 TaxID=1261545 RepID=U3AEA7_9EURY|nr:DUF5305 family protein [Halarchaeum acidiphilum]GAD53108.1 hypothetical protein MBEHAL_1868 [Halarchaeum acidiphilum MH1-52-1]
MLAKRGPAVALAFAVLAAAAFGAAAWTATHPPTVDVTDRENVQTAALGVTGRATVTGNGSLHDPGTALDDPVVYPRTAPVLHLTVRTTSANASFERVAQNASLVYTATRSGETFWTRTVPLGAGNATDTTTASTPVSIDTERVRDRLATYRREAGDTGTVDVAVRVTSTYRVAGYAGTLSTSGPLSFGEDWYDVETEGATREHDRAVARTVTVPSTRLVPPWALGGAGVACALAALLVFYWYRAWRTSAPRLAETVHRHRYDEWISTGRVPATSDLPLVETATLEDLVDIAIDAGLRVIHDPDRGRYVVVTPGARYRYDERDESHERDGTE